MNKNGRSEKGKMDIFLSLFSPPHLLFYFIFAFAANLSLPSRYRGLCRVVFFAQLLLPVMPTMPVESRMTGAPLSHSEAEAEACNCLTALMEGLSAGLQGRLL